MKRIIILTISFLLCVGLVRVSLHQALKAAWQEERESAARSLRVERSEVEQELNRLLERHNQVVIGKGCVTLFVEELYSEFYTDALPLLAERRMSGVLCLSEKQLPGQEDRLTEEEFHSLTENGWETCLFWDGEGELTQYVRRMNVRLAERSIPQPTTLYIAYGRYTPELDEEIQACGFTTVVHHCENGEVIVRADNEPLFHLGCVAWNAPHIRSTLEQTGEYGGALGIFMDFSTASGVFQEERFGKMLDYLRGKGDRLLLTGVKAARESLSPENTEDYFAQRKAYLEGELERYDQEIAAIYELTPEDFEITG